MMSVVRLQSLPRLVLQLKSLIPLISIHKTTVLVLKLQLFLYFIRHILFLTFDNINCYPISNKREFTL